MKKLLIMSFITLILTACSSSDKKTPSPSSTKQTPSTDSIYSYLENIEPQYIDIEGFKKLINSYQDHVARILDKYRNREKPPRGTYETNEEYAERVTKKAKVDFLNELADFYSASESWVFTIVINNDGLSYNPDIKAASFWLPELPVMTSEARDRTSHRTGWQSAFLSYNLEPLWIHVTRKAVTVRNRHWLAPQHVSLVIARDIAERKDIVNTPAILEATVWFTKITLPWAYPYGDRIDFPEVKLLSARLIQANDTLWIYDRKHGSDDSSFTGDLFSIPIGDDLKRGQSDLIDEWYGDSRIRDVEEKLNCNFSVPRGKFLKDHPAPLPPIDPKLAKFNGKWSFHFYNPPKDPRYDDNRVYIIQQNDNSVKVTTDSIVTASVLDNGLICSRGFYEDGEYLLPKGKYLEIDHEDLQTYKGFVLNDGKPGSEYKLYVLITEDCEYLFGAGVYENSYDIPFRPKGMIRKNVLFYATRIK